MIRSKIEARERALELTVKIFETSISFLSKNFMEWVTLFEEYLIGDAELPEVVDDNDNFKTLIDIINQEMVAFRKQGNDNLESLIKTLEERENGAMALTCKSDAE